MGSLGAAGEPGTAAGTGRGCGQAGRAPAPVSTAEPAAYPRIPREAKLCRYRGGHLSSRLSRARSPGWCSGGQNPWLLLGCVKCCRAEGTGSSWARPAARVLFCPQVPRGIGAHSPRDTNPLRSARGRCAADARQRSIRPSAHTRLGDPRECCIRHGKRSAAPHFPQCHGPRPVPSDPKARAEPEGSAAPQRPRTRTAPAAALPETKRL